MALEDMMYTLSDLGVVDVLMPFILVFTIVFAVLQKAKILGTDKRNFNVVIALVMALSVVIPHVTHTYEVYGVVDIVDVINTALPQVSVVLIAIVMVLLMIGIWGAEVSLFGGSPAGWIVVLSGAAVFLIFGSSAGWFGPEGIPIIDRFLTEDMKALVVIILIFGVIIWFITRDPSDQLKASGTSRFMESLGDMFGGGGRKR